MILFCLFILVLTLLLYNKYAPFYSWGIDIIIAILTIVVIVYCGIKFIKICPEFIFQLAKLIGRVV